jgi:glycosyltransferase involved in cell wall biosynthesis
MRILYAHSFYRVAGGEDRHVRDQVDLVARTHDVKLISESNSDLPETAATAARMLYSGAKKREVLATIDRFAPDVVHLHNSYPSLGPAVVLAARERRIPIVMTVHNHRLRCPNGLMFTKDKLCRRCEAGLYVNAIVHRCFPTKKQAGAYASSLWAHRFIMRLEQGISCFIAPSEFMRRRLLEWGIRAERVRMVRHFTATVDDSRATNNVGSYGMFAGRLSAEKGVDVLLTALERAGNPPFLVIGDGPEATGLRALAATLNLTNTRFLGWRPREELERLMAAARYVAIPSVWHENAPIVALEALAAARPLLVSEMGGLPELVANGSGVLFRSGDSIDLSRHIVRLERDDEFCLQASRAAMKFARQWLTPAEHLAGIESLYREITAHELSHG